MLSDAGSDVTVLGQALRGLSTRSRSPSATASTCRASTSRRPSRRQRTSLRRCAARALVFLAVPSQTLRQNLLEIEPFLEPTSVLVSLRQGRRAHDNDAHVRGHRTTRSISEPERIAVVSRPEHCARDRQGAANGRCRLLRLASRSPRRSRTAASAPYFRTYVNTDVVGTELGGVLKNLIALAIGIVDGVGYGENTKASIITRGLAEMTEFSVASGGDPASRSPVSPASATSSRPASHRSLGTTPPAGLSARATRRRRPESRCSRPLRGSPQCAPILETRACAGHRDAHRGAGPDGARAATMAPDQPRPAPGDRRRHAPPGAAARRELGRWRRLIDEWGSS